ncbi:gamma-tubulin complex component 6-like isoform X1 [Entelurus aequoreus]|uniref:gamma-tubulin complex component 6-like isoform X1 n=1 Tax=Entelurus aequoreus TaxID=161455 RepID=UPI002B1D40F8|nr:gamma-tubulin complex component 6-like isoform X1 [Entelurus aequoreus]XP_061891481.1 gamma-tubulin complex component 6-like isoform X1 [Entelurus aequoreus]XP_061891482.1 gamma-tubulin complex component 6-like isoform X1 [Entelurus aequoreus]
MYPIPQHSTKSSCSSSSSITELLAALCDSNLAGVSWKRRAVGGVSREGFRRALKRRAYGSLLSKLFQDGTKAPPALGPMASAPPRNKVIMICFDLRRAGCQEEAEKLEEQLEKLPEGAASGLSEVDAVLELLVHLAGATPPPPSSFSRDYMRRERPVLRRPLPWPYQSQELQRLEARAWGLICAEEWASLDSRCVTQRLMDAEPGTGLLALRAKMDTEEKFERETRLTLFGALQHSRTSDLDIRLDMPPLPSNVDVTGLSIKVPPCLDQSEDEGFQSASNLTPDSQSEPSPSPELDVWEALKTFQPGVRRCWETIGWPPGRRDRLYLSESGREAFDQIYRLWEGEMRVVNTSAPPPILPLYLDSQTLVGDLLNVLIGVASSTFPLNKSVQFDVRPGVCVSGTSPESMSCLLEELAQYGTYYLRLSRFSLQSADKKGLVFQAFTGGLRKYLHYYRACVLSTPATLSLLTIGFLFRKVGRQLRYLWELCRVDEPAVADQASFPVGVKLLSYLYKEAQNNCSNENYPVLLSLLKSSCEPYTRFVSDWVYSGVFRDVYREFMIQVNEEHLSVRDKHFWVHGYTLISKDVEECVPVFLRHIANDVYVCGKTINLLKICCPQHYICLSELPVPRIAVTFSLQEVEQIERDCAVYRGRMERIAKHSAISREVQAQRAEEARQELINQVRASAAKTLENICGRQVSQRLVEEAKKRECFEKLKQHLEQEKEWRSTAKKKQDDDDNVQEKRPQAPEEQLEQRARKELIAQYSRLSEEAVRRERRALWRDQRMTFDAARSDFFVQEQKQLKAMLEKYPLGQESGPALPAQHTSSLDTPTQEVLETKQEETQESESSHRAVDTAAFTSGDILPGIDAHQVDAALQEIGSHLPEVCPTEQLIDYDFSAPFSPLEGITSQPKPCCDVIHNHPSYSHFLMDENVPLIPDSLPQARRLGHASKSSFPIGQCTPEEMEHAPKKSVNVVPCKGATQLGQGDGSVVLEEETGAHEGVVANKDALLQLNMDSVCNRLYSMTCDYNIDISIHQNDVKVAYPSDSPINIGENVSDTPAPLLSSNIRGHSSDAHIKVGENVSDFVAPLSARNLHNHATDGHIRVGENVSEVAALLPSPSIHGHATDAHIKVGENVSDFVAPLPARNLHGHATDAHIKVGENVSAVAPLLPSPSIHGHATDAHIKVGENVSDFVAPLPARNLHGHATDAHIKVGENVSEVAALLPSPSIHDHSPDAHIKVGENVSDFVAPRPARKLYSHATNGHIKVEENILDFVAPLPARNLHGHATDAHIKVSENVSEVAALLPSPSIHGPATDAHIKVGENVSDFVATLPARNLHGHATDAHIKVGENISEVAAPLPSPSIHGHATDAHIKVGENVSDFVAPLPARNLHGHATDAHIKVSENVSEVAALLPSPSIHGHATDAHIKVGENVSDFVAPLPARNLHGHATDAHIKVGENISEVAAPLPSASVHGHATDAHIKVGENMSNFVAPLPARNLHGHATDAHIKVGENVSDFVAPLPARNPHGHATDAHIKVGENVSAVADPLPSPSVHGHSSDANIKVGEFVSNVPEARPRWSKYGHVSDCTLQPGCVVLGSEPASTPLPGSAYGHASDSTLVTGCVVEQEAIKLYPIPGSAHGHSSDTNLGVGCMVTQSNPPLLPLPGSQYGHSSDSALGVGCVVLGAEPQVSPLPGSQYGHSSHSSLGAGCVVGGTAHPKEDAQVWESETCKQQAEGAGLDLSPRETFEQEYILALSAQYHVDHYEDCYNVMASSPKSQLLKHMTRGPWGLPVELGFHQATDTTAVQLSEMVSLPVLIKNSVTAPLITHVSLVNKAAVDYFFVELGVERHFEALRHFLLMEDGEFAQSLSDRLFEKLGSGQTPGELLTPLVLNSILNKALQYSQNRDTPHAANFTFALRFLPDTFRPHAPDSLNCLELRYKVDWPLNIIITDSCLNQYNRLFSFQLQLKHMVWSLRDVWFHLKRTALVKDAGRSVQFRQLQLYRHEMQHFVKVIQGYIANQILQVSWSEFTAKMATACDLDAIHRTHADYLNRAIFRALLTKKAAPVMNIIHSIFSFILKFRAQLIAQPWSSQQGEAVHPSFIAMQQSYNTFKYYSHFLFKVVTKLVNRGYQPHLEDFLLRINFNNYYKDS